MRADASAPRVVVARSLLDAVAPELDGLGCSSRYQLLDRIARGSMGVVYRAIDRRLGRVVALKLVRRRDGHERPRSPDVAYARLRVEARAMAGLAHPNVVPLFAIETIGSGLVIAMEYVPGVTLAEWLGARRSWREILGVLCAAGEGLAAAHAAGVIHRDVKPQNVLIGEDGRARVTDFGLAMLADAPISPTEDDGFDPVVVDESLTQTGMSVGTPAYMALEQHTGDPVDARTDQFGFCAMLYEALFGTRPFLGTSVLGLARAKRNLAVQVPTRGADVPAAVRRVVLRGLAPNPHDRHPSMPALLAALRHAAAAKPRKWQSVVFAVFAASLACTLAMAPAAADQIADATHRRAHGRPAVRVSGVLGEVARLSQSGDVERADRMLSDVYFDALSQRSFADAARAADVLARMHARRGDHVSAMHWRRHAEAARLRGE